MFFLLDKRHRKEIYGVFKPWLQYSAPKGNTTVATLSVIKSLNVIIITHRGEIATLSVIKYIFITLRVDFATLYVIIITFRVGVVHVRKNVYKLLSLYIIICYLNLFYFQSLFIFFSFSITLLCVRMI